MSDRLSVAEVDCYFRDCDALVGQDKPYAAVFDCTGMLLPDAHQLRRQVQWIRENFKRVVVLNQGVAFVMPNLITRSILRAINHFEPIPIPYEVFPEVEPARKWAAERL